MKLNDKLLSLVDGFKDHNGEYFYKDSCGKELEGFNYYFERLEYRLKECIYQYNIEDWVIPYIELLNGIVKVTEYRDFYFNGQNCAIKVTLSSIYAKYFIEDRILRFPIGHGGKSYETVTYGDKVEYEGFCERHKIGYYELNPITHTLKYDEPDGTTKVYDVRYFFDVIYEGTPTEFTKIIKSKHLGYNNCYVYFCIDKEDKLYCEVCGNSRKFPIKGKGVFLLVSGLKDGSITPLSYEHGRVYYEQQGKCYVFKEDFGVKSEGMPYIIHNNRVKVLSKVNIEGSEFLQFKYWDDVVLFNVDDNIVYSTQLDGKVTVIKSDRSNNGYIIYDTKMYNIENVFFKGEEVYINGVLFTDELFTQLKRMDKKNFDFFS